MRSLILFISIMFLFGCGLKPLYQVNDEKYDILTQIKIGNVEGEKNYLMKHYLDHALNPNNISAQKRFVLDVIISNHVSNTLVLQDSTTTSSDMIVVANFNLRSIDNDNEVKSGALRVVTNFEEPQSSYASFVQKNKAYDNALKEIVRSIKGNILVALLNKNYITNEDRAKTRK
jgi:hypothetical protein